MLRRYGKGEGELTTYLFIQLDKQLIRDVIGPGSRIYSFHVHT